MESGQVEEKTKSILSPLPVLTPGRAICREPGDWEGLRGGRGVQLCAQQGPLAPYTSFAPLTQNSYTSFTPHLPAQ